MKKILLSTVLVIILLSVLLSNIVLASVEDELTLCGEDIRCKFRVAAEQKEDTSCESLTGKQYEDCRNMIKKTTKPESERFIIESAKYINESLNPVKNRTHQAGAVIVVIAFVFMLGLLFANYIKHTVFVTKHGDIINFIKESRKKNIEDEKIKIQLEKAGWDSKMVTQSFHEVKKLR